MSRDSSIQTLSLRQILAPGQNYRVPIYQRNYAWGYAEIAQLVHDIFSTGAERYYLGTLVVDQAADGVFEVIDGQQRLTILALLAAWLKSNGYAVLSTEPNLKFACRPWAEKLLCTLFAGGTCSTEEVEGASSLLRGYHALDHALKQEMRTSSSKREREEPRHNWGEFFRHLLDRVLVLRVSVPPGTDLNHYFEIMNSRGEQLEQHEVLKARFLGWIEADAPTDEQRIQAKRRFALIWDACSEMGEPLPFQSLFGSGTCMQAQPFDGLPWREDAMRKKISGVSPDIDTFLEARSLTLAELLEEPTTETHEPPKEKTEKATIINFPNFLLHVLRIVVAKSGGREAVEQVRLDDRHLLSAFSGVLGKIEAGATRFAWVKEFAFRLLRLRHLLDVCIHELIENDEVVGDIQNESGVLLAAFHASSPAQTWKHWLTAVLWDLDRCDSPETSADRQLHFLRDLARTFLIDHGLVSGVSYEATIFEHQGKTQYAASIDAATLGSALTYPNVSHFVFNYLDYLIWKSQPAGWRRSFRSKRGNSVEHFHPQALQGEIGDLIHRFGNLCLLDSGENSRLSNLRPEAKRGCYPNGKFDSLKQGLMFECLTKFGRWDRAAIDAHEEKMLDLLLADIGREDLKSAYMDDWIVRR